MTINGDSLLRHFPISRRTRVFIFVIHKYNHPPPAESASIKSKCSHTDSPLSDTRAHLFHVLCRRRRRRRPPNTSTTWGWVPFEDYIMQYWQQQQLSEKYEKGIRTFAAQVL